MNNYSNNKPHDPYGFKEEIKIKFDALKVVIEKFPNKTGLMMELLKAEVPPVNWAGYCALPVTDQLVWEERSDTLAKSILFLMNSKNNNTKENLHLLIPKKRK